MVGVKSIPSPAISADDRSHEVDHPSSPVAHFGADQPLRLDCGIDLSPFQIAYQIYGELNADRSNAILICHALTLDQHVANVHPLTGKPGWWEIMVGPGRPLDTDKYFIICSNVIGGCMGSTGPASTNPATGKVWGLDFPIITIPDMVRAQAMLLDRLGIETLLCVVGGRWAACRCCNGPRPIRTACSPRSRPHAARVIRRRTSPSTSSAGRRSWPIRTGMVDAMSIRRRIRIAASPWRGWPGTSPISRTRRCTASSTAHAGPRAADLFVRR